MTSLEELEKLSKYRKEIAFFEDCICDPHDHYKVTYKFKTKKIKISAAKMAERLGIAFGECFKEKKTGKALRKDILNLIDVDGSEEMLNHLERWPKKDIAYEGNYIVLGKKFREAFGISDDHKTIDEKIDEKIAELPAESKESSHGINEKIEKEKRKKIIIKRYHAILGGIVFLAGLYTLATNKTVDKYAERAYNHAEKSFYGIKEGIKNADLAGYFIEKWKNSSEDFILKKAAEFNDYMDKK